MNATNSTTIVAVGVVFTEEVYKLSLLISVGFIGFALSLVGVPTNALTCLVFARQGLRERMNLCLFCLALADLLLMALMVGYSLSAMFSELRVFGFGEEQYDKTLFYAVSSIYSLRATSGCYNMVIAVERCVCVMFPLKAASLIRTKTMGLLLAALPLLLQAGFVTVPLSLRLSSTEVKGTVQWHLLPSKSYIENQFVFDLILYTILGTALPLITFFVISAATLLTVLKLKVSIKWREKTSSLNKNSQRHQTALTKVLVVVSLVYIVTMLPFVGYVTTHLATSQFSLSGNYQYLYMTMSTIVNVCPMINCSFNFFIYYTRSSRFQEDVRGLCRVQRKS